MRRKLFLTAIVLCLAVALTACGVPKDKYDSAITERDAAKAQLDSTSAALSESAKALATAKADLEAAQAELTRTKAELDRTKADLQSTSSSLSAANSKVSQLQQSMAKAKVLADLNASIFVPYLRGDVVTPAQETAIGLSFITGVTTSNDPKLKALFDAWVNSGFADYPMFDLFLYVFETLPKLLQ